MEGLMVDDATLQKYKVLQREHLRADTGIVTLNMRGTRNSRLAWIWGLHDPDGHQSPEWMNERASFWLIYMIVL